jgi:Pyruvate/2-oxoacid:ferredoxin oxidoreductase gamma subunit
MTFGVLRDERPADRPVRTPEPAPERVGLDAAFPSALDRPRGLVLAGAAGQKIKSAALAFGRAAVRSGLHATQKDDYPITVRTGHSVSEVIVSPRPVRFTGIETPDFAVVLAAEGLSRARGPLAAMPESALVLADGALEIPPTRARIVRIDARGAARRYGEPNVALWALGRLLGEDAVLPPEALRDAVARYTSPAHREAALRAVAG